MASQAALFSFACAREFARLRERALSRAHAALVAAEDAPRRGLSQPRDSGGAASHRFGERILRRRRVLLAARRLVREFPWHSGRGAPGLRPRQFPRASSANVPAVR